MYLVDSSRNIGKYRKFELGVKIHTVIAEKHVIISNSADQDARRKVTGQAPSCKIEDG